MNVKAPSILGLALNRSYNSMEIFVVEIFSYAMLCTKIKRMCIINVHGKGLFVQNLSRKIFNTQFKVCKCDDSKSKSKY